MSENVPPATDPLPANAHPVLDGLKLAEEAACRGYVEARKVQVALAARLESLHRLLVEQPRRTDYRLAWNETVERFRDARERTDLAYTRWQDAMHRYDLRWQDTEGRRPRPGMVA
jgi:hypothetical protein